MARELLDALALTAPAAALALGDPDAAEHALEVLFDAARTRFPGIRVERATVARRLGEKLAADDAPPLGAELVSELVLALGCAAGDGAALAHFERDYLAVVPQALGHMRLPAATIDDVRAAVRTKLCVAEPGGEARIVTYAGRGRLRGLVQVSAVRSALDLVRATGREQPLDAALLPDRAAAEVDPGLALLAARSQAAFREAFAEAARALEPRDRTLLRLHFLGAMTLEALAAMYGVHRATVVRWLAAARRALFTATKRGMHARLGVSGDELESMMRLIESRLDASVRRLFAETDSQSDT